MRFYELENHGSAKVVSVTDHHSTKIVLLSEFRALSVWRLE